MVNQQPALDPNKAMATQCYGQDGPELKHPAMVVLTRLSDSVYLTRLWSTLNLESTTVSNLRMFEIVIV